jgi:hypothetical protein
VKIRIPGNGSLGAIAGPSKSRKREHIASPPRPVKRPKKHIPKSREILTDTDTEDEQAKGKRRRKAKGKARAMSPSPDDDGQKMIVSDVDDDPEADVSLPFIYFNTTDNGMQPRISTRSMKQKVHVFQTSRNS